MDYVFYLNNRFYGIFLSFVFCFLCSISVYAETDPEPYLENEVAQEDITDEMLTSAEAFCKRKIKDKESTGYYQGQLLKIEFDRIFLRNFKNPLWVLKQINNDKKKLLVIQDEKDKGIIQTRISRYERRLEILMQKHEPVKKLKKKPRKESVAAVRQE